MRSLSEDASLCKLEIDTDQVRLSNDKVILSYDTQRGFVSLFSIDKNTTFFTRAYIIVRTEKHVFISKDMIFRRVDTIDFRTKYGPAKSIVIRLQSINRDAEIHVKFTMWMGLSGFTCMTQFKNNSTETRTVHSIEPFLLDIDNELRIFTGNNSGHLRVYKNGYHSWDLTQSKKIEPGTTQSHLFTVIHNRVTQDSMVIGFVTSTEQLTTIHLRGTDTLNPRLDRIIAFCELDDLQVQAGASVLSEELLISVGRRPHQLVREYVELTASKMKSRGGTGPITGWSSWYYYFTAVDQYEIVKNADILRERFSDVKWVQIDDGYQRTIGDWIANDRFSQGLDSLVKKINERDLKAGIWVAPFIASKYSDLFKDHPHWFVRNRDNEPIPVGSNPLWFGEYYALDLTEPAVIQFVKDLFRRFKNCGFELFKIDFLYHATQIGCRHDETKTRAQALRNGLIAIREAVGDSIILGSGAPLGPSIGIIDIMRIGTDISTTWRHEWGSGVYECAINTMTRAFLHDHWWTNDPDCIIVRQDDNSLTLDELQLWLTVVALSGGAIHISDKLDEVAEERLRLVDKILPPYGKDVIAVDVFTEEEPRIIAQRIVTPRGTWSVVAIINLAEKEISVQVDLASLGMTDSVPHHIFEFWSRQYEGTVEEILHVTDIKPHTCKLFVVKPETMIPSVLSTSIHFTQGAVEIKDEQWDEAKNELRVTISRDTRHTEMVFIVFGPLWRPKYACVNTETVDLLKVAPEVVAIRYQFRAGHEIRVGFSKIL